MRDSLIALALTVGLTMLWEPAPLRAEGQDLGFYGQDSARSVFESGEESPEVYSGKKKEGEASSSGEDTWGGAVGRGNVAGLKGPDRLDEADNPSQGFSNGDTDGDEDQDRNDSESVDEDSTEEDEDEG